MVRMVQSLSSPSVNGSESSKSDRQREVSITTSNMPLFLHLRPEQIRQRLLLAQEVIEQIG